MKFRYLLLVLLFSPIFAKSQNFYILKGFILNELNEAIPSASIRVVNQNIGTKSEENGSYSLKLLEGINRVSVTAIGYEGTIVEVVNENDLTKNFILKINQKQLDEVVIKYKKHDFSYEVIKQVLEKKPTVLNQLTNYKCKTYIKSVEEILKKPSKPKNEANDEPVKFEDNAKAKIEKKDTSKTLNYFECTLTRYENSSGQQKEEKNAVKKIGEQTSLYFKSISDGEFNLYKNTQKIIKIGDNQITSPLSDLTFLSYKFELLNTKFDEKQQKYYQIKVTPRNLGNALYEGTLEVYDGIWVLKSIDLNLNKRALLLYDDFNIKQEFENYQGKWMPKNIIYEWKLKEGSTKKIGKTLIIQSDFEFDINHPKRFFGNEVGITTTLAYKRDSVYWENIRPVELTKDEKQTIIKKEKLDLLLTSKVYLDSIDKVENKLSFMKLTVFGFSHTNRTKKTVWYFNPIIGVFNPLSIGGLRIGYGTSHFKRFESRKQISGNVNLNYGVLNKDILGGISANYTYNPIKNSTLRVMAGSGFNIINGAATINDFIRRSNFYKNKYGLLGHRTELFNGFYLNSQVYYELRQDLENYKLTKFGDQLFTQNNFQSFEASHIFKTSLGIEYTPGQLYLKEPNQKIILGSKYPTFSFNIDRAWPIPNLNSNQYTYFSSSISQKFSIGIIGNSEYRISMGKFLDTTQLAPMDYKYQRGGDLRFFSPAMSTFQLIPKTFVTNNWYFESHYVHQFNGFLSSKIPLFNKTKIREMVGGGYLYVPESNYKYAELFFGLNKVIKVGKERVRIGTYYVAAQSNDFGFRNGFKFSIELYNQNRNTWSF